jgi:zinc transport system substrate-binding protein
VRHRTASAFALSLIAGTLAGLTIAPAAAAGPINVYVSILPQKRFVERVGGEHVRVSVMVPPGRSPATYEPTPRQMAGLSDADLYVRIGVAFEEVWMDRLAAANPHMAVIDAREGITLRPVDRFDGEDHHAHAGGRKDPHIWTAPPLVARMAATIRDALIEADPAHAADYRANHQAFAADLERLDADIRETLSGLDTRRFMVFHPSWGYFADAYGLTQVPIESEGKEPGPRLLARIIDQARAEDIRVIFVQKQFSRRDAQTVARAMDGRVVAVDPLAEDYLGNMREVAGAFAEALR